MPKNQPAVETKTRQAKKKQTKPIRSSNKRSKPDLIEYDRFPQLDKANLRSKG